MPKLAQPYFPYNCDTVKNCLFFLILEAAAIYAEERFSHTPAVVQQEAEQAQQDESHASQYSQQKHSVVCADVPRNQQTYWKDRHSIKRRI